MFFGVIGKLSEAENRAIDNLEHRFDDVMRKDSLVLLVSGIKDNIQIANRETETVAVFGYPLVYSNRKYSKYDISRSFHFDKNIHSNRKNLNDIEGHFCGVRYDGARAELFNDIMGYRDLYYVCNDDRIIFSSRLDILTSFTDSYRLDNRALGSLWYLHNHISEDCVISGINRLAAGAYVSWENGKVEKISTPYIPDIKPCTEDELNEQLRAFFAIADDNGKASQLALSGGMDSRYLLAFFADKACRLFTLGNPKHPDCYIAKALAEKTNRSIAILEPETLKFNDIIGKAEEFCGITALTVPCSEMLLKERYKTAGTPDSITFDGGVAEMARRGLYNRLLFDMRGKLNSAYAEEITRKMLYFSSDIFADEVKQEQLRYAEEAVAELFDKLPDEKQIGSENFVDLLGLRTKLPNYIGQEQARMDEFMVNLTPFVQKTILNTAFGLPLSEKNSARMVKRFIRNNCPALAQVPLVKGDVTYPFSMPNLPAKVFAKIKKCINLNYFDTSKNQFLLSSKEFMLDTLNSADYDSRGWSKSKAKALAERFFAGESSLMYDYDKLLTIELFYRSCRS